MVRAPCGRRGSQGRGWLRVVVPPQGFAIFPHAYDSEGHSGGAGVGVFGMHMILRLLSRAFVLLWIRIHMIPLKLAVERLAKSG